MDNAVYAATTGMLNRAKALDITGNNIANVNTAGYKQQQLTTRTFGEYVTYRVSAEGKTPIGQGTHGCIADSIYSDISQGTFQQTGRSLDLAIAGDGFFVTEDQNGNRRLTRDGNFYIDGEGYLTAASGAYVVGQNGTINLGASAALTVGADGTLSADGQYLDRLSIVVPDNAGGLAKQADGTYTYAGGTGAFTGNILQGSLELSNVDMTEQMATMIEESRSFQSLSQIVRILDTVNQKAVNEIGEV
jgi:flagellar basal-body rod protein FlgF